MITLRKSTGENQDCSQRVFYLHPQASQKDEATNPFLQMPTDADTPRPHGNFSPHEPLLSVLRAKKCVMKTVTTIQENASDIYADAKEINENREAAEEAYEDVSPVEAEGEEA